MLNAELDSSLETALQLLDPQRPNSNIKAQLANAGINADLVTTHSGALQNILEQLQPIAKRILPYTAGGNATFRMRSRRDNKDLSRLRRLRKALHTAVRLHRHSKLHSAKTGKAAQVCHNVHTAEGQPETQPQNELQTKIAALMDSVETESQVNTRTDFQDRQLRQMRMHGQTGRKNV